MQSMGPVVCTCCLGRDLLGFSLVLSHTHAHTYTHAHPLCLSLFMLRLAWESINGMFASHSLGFGSPSGAIPAHPPLCHKGVGGRKGARAPPKRQGNTLQVDGRPAAVRWTSLGEAKATLAHPCRQSRHMLASRFRRTSLRATHAPTPTSLASVWPPPGWQPVPHQPVSIPTRQARRAARVCTKTHSTPDAVGRQRATT